MALSNDQGSLLKINCDDSWRLGGRFSGGNALSGKKGKDSDLGVVDKLRRRGNVAAGGRGRVRGGSSPPRMLI